MENRLYSPKRIQEVLKSHGFRFSKGLGQNFLIDGNIVRKICEVAEIGPDDCVLEIGPGFGTLTEELAMRAAKVVAIELDDRLLPVLNQTLQDHDNVKIVHGDAMKVDLAGLIHREFADRPVKVVANLPYYVTSPIIARFIEGDLPVISLTVMVQKEVADRLVAGPTDKAYGSLSLFAQFYADVYLAMKVPRAVFMPSPKVDSAVVHMRVKTEVVQVDRKLLFDLIHSGFGKRRKRILNSLSSGYVSVDKEGLQQVLDDLRISPNLRAENLSLEQYIKIARALSDKWHS